MNMIGEKMTKQEVMQEDVNNMIGDMIDAVLKTVSLNDEEQDKLWDELLPPMEKFFDYPGFRHYN